VAVATRTAGRNLEPYHTLHHGALRVLISPDLERLATTLRVSTRRWVTQGFQIELVGEDTCAL
jgi:hypothetical protein